MMRVFAWLALVGLLSIVACSESDLAKEEVATGAAGSQSESRASAAVDRVETQQVALGEVHTSMAASGESTRS